MSQDIERVRARLSNIRTVAPILAALRTISLGSWQMALNRRGDLQKYSARLLDIIPLVLPQLPRQPLRDLRREWGARISRLWPYGHTVAPATDAASRAPKSGVALVIGSERGLCGRFNTVVVEYAERYLTRRAVSGGEIELAALGARAARELESLGRSLAWRGKLPVTALAPYSLAEELTRGWLQRYEAYEIDAVDVIYNAYQGAGRYAPTIKRLLPPELPDVGRVMGGEIWPPVVVETDPLSLYTRVVEQWATLDFYALLLDSAAAEHSARYQLMESATQNTDRLVEELTMEVQAARRQAITSEMQELAVGAGMLG